MSEYCKNCYELAEQLHRYKQVVEEIKEILNKKYDISLHFGNTEKTILEMDEVDICYGLPEKDKNEIILLLIERIKNERN